MVLDAKTGWSVWRKPSTVLSFRLMWVTTPPACSRVSGSTAKPWFWLVISTLPVSEVLDGLVAAAVAELELVGAAADGEAEELVAEADAEDRQLGRDQLADAVDAYSSGAGSPGPFDRKTPSGA